MQFKLTHQFLSIITALSLLTTHVFAQETVTYTGYSDTRSCKGSSFSCKDKGGLCCQMPTGFGFSAQFNGLPARSQGQGWSNSICTDFVFAVFGPGTKCWNGGGTRASSLGWFHSAPGRRRAIEEKVAAENCTVTPDVFNYVDLQGEERTIKVPTFEGAAETVASLYFANNYTALAEYENAPV